MAREVADEDGIVWTCIEAYAGLNDDPENRAAARANSDQGEVTVVCTPSGGAKSVRLELQSDWEEKLGDDALLTAIATGE